jgi:hypothetical protein
MEFKRVHFSEAAPISSPLLRSITKFGKLEECYPSWSCRISPNQPAIWFQIGTVGGANFDWLAEISRKYLNIGWF